MNSIIKPKVLIVGAGPVGLTLGILFSLNSIPFRIIEQQKSRSNYSRAFTIHPRTLEIFSQIGVINDIYKLSKCSTIGGQYFRNNKLLYDMNLPEAKSSQPLTVGLLQSETEKVLENKLNKLGYYVEYDKTLTKLIEQDNQYTKAIINNEEQIEFDYIVGCDGGRSKTRKEANIPFIGESLDIELTCIDFIFESELNKSHLATILTTEKEMAFVFWINDTEARFLTKKETEEIDDKEFIEMMSRLTNKIKVKDITWKSSFNINECQALEFNKSNLFLCGDAAHTHSPAGAFGMNTGIQDAYNLSWKLSLIIKGIGNANILSNNFNQERKMTAQIAIEESGKRIRNSFGKSNWCLNAIKSILLPILIQFDFVKNHVVNTLSGVGMEYPDNVLIKKINPGYIYNCIYKGVGKRINDYKLLCLNQQQPITMHKLLKGKDEFELFIYLPKPLFEVNNFNNLFKLLNSLNQQKFKQLQQSGENTLININLLLTEPIDINEYFNSFSSTYNQDHIVEVKNKLQKYGLIIDDFNILYDLNILSSYPSVMVVRPDAHIGLLKVADDLKEVIEYFEGFMK